MTAYIVCNQYWDNDASTILSVWLREDLAKAEALKKQGWVESREISTESVEAI